MQRCIEKADLLTNLIPKMCYSRPIMHRRIVYNLHKLNTFFELSEKWDWGVSDKAESEMSEMTVDSGILKGLVAGTKNITYKTLLDHMEQSQ